MPRSIRGFATAAGLAALILSAAGTARASDAGAVSPSFTGLSGAYRALAYDEAAIEYNPAGMTQFGRYTLAGAYRRDNPSDSNAYSISLMDSTAPLFKGGIRVGRHDGNYLAGKKTRLDSITVALAAADPETPTFSYGVSAKYLRAQGEDHFTFDFTALAKVVDPIFQIGIVGENLNSVEVEGFDQVGGYNKRAGAAFGLIMIDVLALDYDVLWDFNDDDVSIGEVISHHFGGELRAAGGMLIFRGGFEINRSINKNFWATGAALCLVRLRLEYAYRQTYADDSVVQHIGSLALDLN